MNVAMVRAELYGKPHLGEAFYHNATTRLGHLRPDAECVLCKLMGKRDRWGDPVLASNAHHIVPKGIGGGSATLHLPFEVGGIELRSPLMAVCGHGNVSGCHAKMHGGGVSVRWEWDEPKYAEWWWKGYFFQDGKGTCIEPHSSLLYSFGRYVFDIYGEEVEFRG